MATSKPARVAAVALVALMAACSSATAPLPSRTTFSESPPAMGDSADTDDTASATDTGSPVTTDPGWTLGTPTPCTSPVPLAFTAQPDLLGTVPLTEEVDEFGSLAWWSEGGNDYIVHTTSAGAELGVRTLAEPEGSGSLITLDQDLRTFLLRDLDKDGQVDLIGLGTGLFVDYSFLSADRAHVSLIPPREDAAVYDVLPLDLDGDGDLDLLLGTNDNPELGEQSPLLRLENLGSRSWGSPTTLDVAGTSATFDLAAIDQNEDGLLDVYVCNDQGALYGSNRLLLADGAGGLVPADDPGFDITTDCMGISHGDINQDGHLDTFLTAMDRHWLLVADGSSAYDATATTLPPLADDQMGWGSAIVDVDNDGREDIVVGTSEFSVPDATPFPLLLLQQATDGTFTDIGATVGLPTAAHTRAVLTRDLNADGIVDIVATDFSGDPHLLLSEGCGADHWLEVDGPAGSVVRVTAGDRTWTHLLTHTPGWSVSQPPRAHIGLGTHTTVDRVTLILPAPGGSRAVHLVGPLDADQRLVWAPSR